MLCLAASRHRHIESRDVVSLSRLMWVSAEDLLQRLIQMKVCPCAKHVCI